MKLSVTLECGIPPRTKKNSAQVFGQGKGMRAVMLPNPAYVEWFEDILTYKAEIKKLFGDTIPIAGPVKMSMIVYREAETGDLGGYFDAVADALQVDVWQCQNPSFEMVETKTRNKKTGVMVPKMSRKSDCAKKIASDVPFAVCPLCRSTMKRKRQGLGLIVDDRQIVEGMEPFKLAKDKLNPRIEIILETLEVSETIEQQDLFEVD